MDNSENKTKDGRVTDDHKDGEDQVATKKREKQTNTQKASRVGNVGRLGDLLILHEPLSIGILYEDVEHDQVVLGVVEYGLHNRAVVVAAVQVFRETPLVVGTKPENILIKLSTNRA